MLKPMTKIYVRGSVSQFCVKVYLISVWFSQQISTKAWASVASTTFISKSCITVCWLQFCNSWKQVSHFKTKQFVTVFITCQSAGTLRARNAVATGWMKPCVTSLALKKRTRNWQPVIVVTSLPWFDGNGRLSSTPIPERDPLKEKRKTKNRI